VTAFRAVVGGLIVILALAAFGVGVIALIRGHIAPLRIRSRGRAAALMVVAVIAFVLSGLVLPTPPHPAPTVSAISTTTMTTAGPITTTTSPPAPPPSIPPTTTPTAPAPPPTTERTVSAPALPTITSVPTTTAGVPITPNSVAPHPPPQPPPAPAVLGPGKRDPIGAPVPLRDGTGATANVTLNGVRYAPVPGASQTGQLVVLDFTVTGTSASPFQYSQNDVQLAYLNSSAESDPAYAHHSDQTAFGSSLLEDYTPFLPPDPLRSGSVSAGKQKRGLVIMRAGSTGPYIAFLGSNGPADRTGQWVLS